MLFYQSWLALSRKLPDPKDAVFQLIEYGIEGREFHPEDELTAMFLEMAKPNIDFNTQAKRGGAPKGNQNAKGNKGGAPKGNQNARTKNNSTKHHNLSDVDVDVDADVEIDADTSSGDLPPLEAVVGSADWDEALARINAEDDDE